VSEWRQFKVLMRASLERLMDTAVASRGIDATQFAIWSFALVLTPPLLFAVRMMSKYALMWRHPQVLERTALADRLFFIVYMMLACALLAAILWDALFPDRQDQEIVGVLPVRPRTLAAARLVAALGVAAVFSAALAVSSGFVYMTNVAAGFRSAAILGWPPAVFVAHFAAVSLAGIFTFASLLALRGIAVACIGAEAAQRAAAVLQLVTVVLLLETLIFLPSVLGNMVQTLTSESASWSLPPLWFMGLYGTLGGPPMARLPGLAAFAVGATIAALLLAFAAYILPATWNARRTLEARMKIRAGRSIAIAARLASPMLRGPTSRAVFAFTLASLARSRRHALILATYLAAAIALAAVRFTAAYVRDRGIPLDAPADHLLALPLVMTFFLVVALHSAFSVPVDVEGNWTFRVAQPRSRASCVHALGVTLVFLAVLPVTLGWWIVTASLWSWREAAAAAAMHAASGVALVELTLIGCCSIPFTRAHVASVRAVRKGWIAGIVALHVFAFRLDDLQLAALRSPRGVGFYVLAMLLIALIARAYRLARRSTGVLDFDAPNEDAPAALNLSQATG
jgi:hypothetical protein